MTALPPPVPAIMLFAPAGDARKVTKALSLAEADAVIADLEDSVAPAAKPAARAACAELLASRAAQPAPGQPAPRPRLWVRINDLASAHWAQDVLAVTRPGLDGIVVPKAESASQLVSLDGALTVLELQRGIEPGTVVLIATIESAGSLARAEAIAASTPRVRCLVFGAADFSRETGIGYPALTPGAAALAAAARTRLLLASAQAGIDAPHDNSYPRYDDPAGLRAEAVFARDMGFGGKHAIHPAQLATLREVFAVPEAEIAEARRIIAAWEQARAAGSGVTSADGIMVDLPVAHRAQQLLARAARQGT